MINLFTINDFNTLVAACDEIEEIGYDAMEHIYPTREVQRDLIHHYVALVNYYISWKDSSLAMWRVCYHPTKMKVVPYKASDYEVPEGYINPNPEE